MNDDAIRLLEHVTLRGWPALESEEYDGWILRAANGYSGRGNSVNPLEPSHLPLAEKITYCETWYATRGLVPKFRLTNVAQPPELDAYLAAQGYRRYNETVVQVIDLEPFSHDIAADFTFEQAVSDEWLADWGRWTNTSDLHIRTAKQMLQSSPAETCYGRIGTESMPQAVALAVKDGDYVGLFDVVVAPEHRRQGLGYALVGSLLAWAKGQGAHLGYLQVAAPNAPALALYARLGFREHHRYWYRDNAG